MSKRILVVDDEPDVLKVISLRLEKTGYEVFSGRCAREAFDLARQFMPDLIILDVYLPDINGDDVARTMKNDHRFKHIPIILISATTDSIAQRAKECGADGYIKKPFEPEELIGEVKNIIG